MNHSIEKISVLEPRLNGNEVERIIRNEHTWFMGLFPPRSFKIEEYRDVFIPYILTEVSYYKKFSQRRKCFIFSNVELGIKSGVVSIDNLKFIDVDAPEYVIPININKDAHSVEIARYCNLDLLVKNYRKYIHWTIDIIEIRRIYRKKRMVWYTANGKQKIKEIFLDNMILK